MKLPSRPRLALVAAMAAAALTAKPLAAAVPPDFSDTLVAAVGAPTALAFTPDGRMLITTQPGALRVYANGSLLSTPALTFASTGANPNICTNSERGLLGVAVDPAFAANGYIYLYYTFRKPGQSCSAAVNRLSRFVLPATNVVSPATETVLIDNIPSTGGNHNGGDVQFGKDGYLYVGVGDGGCDYAGDSGCAGANDAARDENALLGKILRITADGGIPADNPFQGPGTARCNVTGSTAPGLKCQETFAWGLRNPFRMGFDPNALGTRFFINDVGQNVWEEIDLGIAGADYGWNEREGPCATGSTTNCGPPPAGMTNPIFTYGRDAGCGAITGGAFVPAGVFPSAYDGNYLFGDFSCGAIFLLTASGGTYSSAPFATGLGANSAVSMTFGPLGSTQALYYTTYASGGQVRRISYSSSANPGLSIDDVSVAEGSAANAAFRVRLAAPSAATVTVQYETVDGTAAAPGDYAATSGTLTFTPGRTVNTVVVPIATDAAVEGTESFSVLLTAPVGASLAKASATGTIADPPPSSHVAMYRAYNRAADYHFFTTDVASKDFAVGTLGYQDESTPVPFYVWNTVQTAAVPLFRMYNPNLGRHYYTADVAGRDFLIGVGMTYEKDEGFLYPIGTTPPAGTTELFRLYNNNSGTHLFTADAAQKDGILSLFPGVWVQHASVGFVFTSP